MSLAKTASEVSTKRIREEVAGLVDFLLAQEMLLDSNVVADSGSDISWHGAQSAPLIRDFGRFTNVADYRDWLTNRQYTALLADGALMQISYSFVGEDILKHRLAYVPCPVVLDAELLTAYPVVDVLDLTLEQDGHAMTMASPIRFDFDLLAASEEHPHSHLTINATHCRIPCLAPLKVGHFVQFVFQNFYPDLWVEHEYLHEFDRGGFGPPTVSDSQAQGLHMNWRGPVPASLRA